MSNTLRFTDRVTYLVDGVTSRDIPNLISDITTTSEIVHDTTQVVGTTAAALSIGDATDTSIVIIQNLHATASVEYGYDATGFVAYGSCKFGDGLIKLGRIDTLANVQLKSSVAATPVRVIVIKIVESV